MTGRVWVATALVLAVAGCGGGGGGGVSRGAVGSGIIARACLSSDRAAATPSLCGCIQQVANQTLSGADQSRASRFFSDPHEAQETRQKDGRASEAFWLRYKNFAATAEQACGGA